MKIGVDTRKRFADTRCMKSLALADALRSAKHHLAEELHACELTKDRPNGPDHKFARAEVAHYRALVERLEARMSQATN